MAIYTFNVNINSPRTAKEITADFKRMNVNLFIGADISITDKNNAIDITFTMDIDDLAEWTLLSQPSETITIDSIKIASLKKLISELEDSLKHDKLHQIAEIEQTVELLKNNQFIANNLDLLLISVITERETIAKESGRNQLALAVEYGNINIVKSLLSEGVSPDSRDKFENTPLILLSSHHFFDQHRFDEIVGCLIGHGADIEATNDLGETALFAAARLGSPENIMSLLKSGINVHHKNNLGDSVIESGNSSPSSVEFIKSYLESKVLTNSICQQNIINQPLTF